MTNTAPEPGSGDPGEQRTCEELAIMIAAIDLRVHRARRAMRVALIALVAAVCVLIVLALSIAPERADALPQADATSTQTHTYRVSLLGR